MLIKTSNYLCAFSLSFITAMKQGTYLILMHCLKNESEWKITVGLYKIKYQLVAGWGIKDWPNSWNDKSRLGIGRTMDGTILGTPDYDKNV